ncbi:MAG: HAD family phosphatase [Erysipelotrichaceae bacterium]|nr:HAD family phosphatase [Erysipelotrichaceae bacterium]
MCKCIFFDFDGTLVDSMPYWERSFKDQLKDRGIEADGNLLMEMSFMNMYDSTQYVINKFHLDASVDELVEEKKGKMRYYYSNEVPLREGVFELLKDLKANGIMTVITTVSSETLIRDSLKRLGIEEYIDGIFSLDDVPYPKTDDRYFIEACRKFSVQKEDVVMFDDSYPALKTAKDFGMKTLAVYEKYSALNWEKILNTADWHLDSFTEWNKVRDEILK